MLWWFVAIVGGWIASGALVPVLWLASNEEPTSRKAIGQIIAGPIMGAAGRLPLAVGRVGLERKRPHANLLIDLPEGEESRRTARDVALKNDASLFICNITIAPASLYPAVQWQPTPIPGAAREIKLATEMQPTPLQAECLEPFPPHFCPQVNCPARRDA
jgi:hypothetical protein